MVLEALAAVGLAGNIVQFIDFGGNLLAEARQIQRSSAGVSEKNVELETVATRLRHIAAGLSSTTSLPGTGISYQLKQLADEAVSIIDELLTAIEDVKMKGTGGGLKSFAHVLQHVGKNKRIEKLRAKLAGMQGQLNTHLYALMR
jgi:hypothetical protein